jgi:hypothetical protein
VNVEHCTFQDMKLAEVASKGGCVVIDGPKNERMSLMSRLKLTHNLKYWSVGPVSCRLI